jgi:hypothetical protein
VVFQQTNPKPSGTPDAKGGHMATQLFRHNAVNTDGAGSPTVILEPGQETAVTMDTANRTGYGEHVCATRVKVGISGQSNFLLDFESISCEERIFVSGFHAVR